MRTSIIAMLVLYSLNVLSQKKITGETLGDFKNGIGYYLSYGNCYLIDTMGNELKIPNVKCPYSTPRFEISENVITVWQNENNVAYYTKSGILIKEFKNIHGFTGFYEGVACVVTSKKALTVNSYSRYGDTYTYKLDFISENGNIIFSRDVNSIYELPKFSSNVCLIKNIGGTSSQLVNKNVKILININESSPQIKECYEGFMFVKFYSDDNKWTFIDTTGKAYKNIMFTNEPENFSQGLSLIKNTSGLFGFMDTKGNIAIEPQFVKAFSFSSEYTVVQKSYGDAFQIIDKTGKVIKEIKGFYPESGVKEGLIKIKLLDRYGYIDISGKPTIKPNYIQLSDFDSNRARYKEFSTGEQGYLNKNGEKVLILVKSEF